MRHLSFRLSDFLSWEIPVLLPDRRFSSQPKGHQLHLEIWQGFGRSEVRGWRAFLLEADGSDCIRGFALGWTLIENEFFPLQIAALLPLLAVISCLECLLLSHRVAGEQGPTV